MKYQETNATPVDEHIVTKLVSEAVYGGVSSPQLVRDYGHIQQEARIGLEAQLPDPDNFGYGVNGTEASIVMKGQPETLHFATSAEGQVTTLDLNDFGLPPLPEGQSYDRQERASFLAVLRDRHEQVAAVMCYTDAVYPFMDKQGRSVAVPGRYALSYAPDKDGQRRLAWTGINNLNSTLDAVGVLLTSDSGARGIVRSEITERETGKVGRRTIRLSVADNTDFDGRVVIIKPASKTDDKITPEKVAQAERKTTRRAKIRAASSGLLFLTGGLSYLQDPPKIPPTSISIDDFKGGEDVSEKNTNEALKAYFEGDQESLDRQAKEGGFEPLIDLSASLDFEPLQYLEGVDQFRFPSRVTSLEDLKQSVNSRFGNVIVVHSNLPRAKESENFEFDPINDLDARNAEVLTYELLGMLTRIDNRLVDEPLNVYFGRNIKVDGSSVVGWASLPRGIMLDINTDTSTVGHELTHVIDQSTGDDLSSAVASVDDGVDYADMDTYKKSSLKNEQGQTIYASTYSSANADEDTAEMLSIPLGSEVVPTFERGPLFNKFKAALDAMEEQAPGSVAGFLSGMMRDYPHDIDIPDIVEGNVDMALRNSANLTEEAFKISRLIFSLTLLTEIAGLSNLAKLRGMGGQPTPGRKKTILENIFKTD